MIGGGIFINTIGGAYRITSSGGVIATAIDYIVKFRRRRRM